MLSVLSLSGTRRCQRRAAAIRQSPQFETVVVTRRRLLADCPIGTGSAFLRRSMLPRLPDWFFLCPDGDFPICVLCMQNGPAGYLDELLGAYRIHEKGFYNGLKSWEQDLYFQYTRKMSSP